MNLFPDVDDVAWDLNAKVALPVVLSIEISKLILPAVGWSEAS